MVKAEARLKTEKKNAVAMPCLLKEDSCGTLLACATLMEASCGTPEADNEMVYDRKHMGHISQKKKDMSEVSAMARNTSPSQFTRH